MVPLSSLSATTQITLGDITLTVGRVTIGVFAKFEGWCKDRIREDAAKFAGMVPAEGRAAILQEAQRMTATFSIMSEEAKPFLTSPKGLVALLHFAQQGTSHSMADIESRLTQENLASLREALFNLAGVTEVDPIQPQSPR
jgi:hypothetical protein